MANKIKVKQITSGASPIGYALIADGSGNTYFSDLSFNDGAINAGTLSLEYAFDTDITDSSPSSGHFKRNDTTLINVTYLYYSVTTSNGVDATTILMKLVKDDLIYFQKLGDSTSFEYYTIVDKPINATTYIKIPVTLVDNGTTLINKNNERCGQLLFFTGSRSVQKGSSFPSNPSNGDMFFRTDLNMVFQYDSTRTKWLSSDRQIFTCGKNSVVAGTTGYMGIADLTFTSTEGFIMPRNGTITSVNYRNANTVTRNIEFRVNNSTTNRVVLTLTAATSGSNLAVNLDFNANDIIQVVAIAGAAGNTVARSIAEFEVAWR